MSPEGRVALKAYAVSLMGDGRTAPMVAATFSAGMHDEPSLQPYLDEFVCEAVDAEVLRLVRSIEAATRPSNVGAGQSDPSALCGKDSG